MCCFLHWKRTVDVLQGALQKETQTGGLLRNLVLAQPANSHNRIKGQERATPHSRRKDSRNGQDSDQMGQTAVCGVVRLHNGCEPSPRTAVSATDTRRATLKFHQTTRLDHTYPSTASACSHSNERARGDRRSQTSGSAFDIWLATNHRTTIFLVRTRSCRWRKRVPRRMRSFSNWHSEALVFRSPRTASWRK